MTPLLKICHNNFVWDLTKILFCCLLSTSEMSFSLLLGGREWARIAFLVLQSRIKLFLVFLQSGSVYLSILYFLSCSFSVRLHHLYLNLLFPLSLWAVCHDLEFTPNAFSLVRLCLEKELWFVNFESLRGSNCTISPYLYELESASIYLSMKSAAVLRLAPKPSTELLPSPVRHLSSVLQLRKPSCLPTHLPSQVLALCRS